MRHRNAVHAILATLVAAVAPALSGCAALQTPYSEVVGDRYHLAVPDRRAVNIVSVGTTNGWANNQAVQVSPGLHRVTVESRSHAGFRGGEVRSFELKVEPCRRYYVNAQFANRASAGYEPVVDEVETIGGCSAEG